MTKHRSDLTKGSPLPSTWINSLMEFISTVATANFAVTKGTGNTVQVVAGTGNDQVGVAINGRWRYNTVTFGPVAVPVVGGTPALFDVFVTAADNDFSAADPADSTNYGFSVAVVAQGSTPATPLFRRVATVDWDGITQRIWPAFGPQGTDPNLNAALIVGEIRSMVMLTAPARWLACDGTSKLRASYPALHAVLKDGPGGANTYPYGFVDGTHFNVPDLQGRVLVGPGTAAGGGIEASPPARAVGTKWGVNAVVLGKPQMPVHNHTGVTGNGATQATGGQTNAGATSPSSSTVVNGAEFGTLQHVHAVNMGALAPASVGAAGSTGGAFFTPGPMGNPDRNLDNHTHGIPSLGIPAIGIGALTVAGLSITSDGGSSGVTVAHENAPPSIAVPVYIYAGV